MRPGWQDDAPNMAHNRLLSFNALKWTIACVLSSFIQHNIVNKCALPSSKPIGYHECVPFWIKNVPLCQIIRWTTRRSTTSISRRLLNQLAHAMCECFVYVMVKT
jgi:hypothetical protein